jgi:alkylhydroperoxidase family enzyme
MPSRLPPPDPESLDPADRAALEAVVSQPIPGAGVDLFRTMARRPAIMRTALAHLAALMEPGAAPADLKALIAVRVAQVNHCVY